MNKEEEEQQQLKDATDVMDKLEQNNIEDINVKIEMNKLGHVDYTTEKGVELYKRFVQYVTKRLEGVEGDKDKLELFEKDFSSNFISINMIINISNEKKITNIGTLRDEFKKIVNESKLPGDFKELLINNVTGDNGEELDFSKLEPNNLVASYQKLLNNRKDSENTDEEQLKAATDVMDKLEQNNIEDINVKIAMNKLGVVNYTTEEGVKLYKRFVQYVTKRLEEGVNEDEIKLDLFRKDFSGNFNSINMLINISNEKKISNIGTLRDEFKKIVNESKLPGDFKELLINNVTGDNGEDLDFSKLEPDNLVASSSYEGLLENRKRFFASNIDTFKKLLLNKSSDKETKIKAKNNLIRITSDLMRKYLNDTDDSFNKQKLEIVLNSLGELIENNKEDKYVKLLQESLNDCLKELKQTRTANLDKLKKLFNRTYLKVKKEIKIDTQKKEQEKNIAKILVSGDNARLEELISQLFSEGMKEEDINPHKEYLKKILFEEHVKYEEGEVENITKLQQELFGAIDNRIKFLRDNKKFFKKKPELKNSLKKLKAEIETNKDTGKNLASNLTDKKTDELDGTPAELLTKSSTSLFELSQSEKVLSKSEVKFTTRGTKRFKDFMGTAGNQKIQILSSIMKNITDKDGKVDNNKVAQFWDDYSSEFKKYGIDKRFLGLKVKSGDVKDKAAILSSIGPIFDRISVSEQKPKEKPDPKDKNPDVTYNVKRGKNDIGQIIHTKQGTEYVCSTKDEKDLQLFTKMAADAVKHTATSSKIVEIEVTNSKKTKQAVQIYHQLMLSGVCPELKESSLNLDILSEDDRMRFKKLQEIRSNIFTSKGKRKKNSAKYFEELKNITPEPKHKDKAKIRI